MEKPMTPRKKQFLPNAFKYMIAVSSIAGTLGIWNLLANKDLVNANSQTNTDVSTSSTQDKAPLPTLVPVITVDLSSLQTNNTVSTTVQTSDTSPLREVARPTAAPVTALPSLEVPPVNNNNNPGATVDQGASTAAQPPAPVTTTQSSKP
ncbi:hypothetical protein EG832_11215 [bacterium]|nr:hypothetical protein [bacterium]